MEVLYLQILSVFLLTAHRDSQCGALEERMVRYIEKRLLTLEDRLYKCEQDIQQYVHEFKEVSHKLASGLDNLLSYKLEVRSEMESLWERMERAESDLDYLESTASSNTQVEVDDHLVEKQLVEHKAEKKKMQHKLSTACSTMLAKIQSQKTVKKSGGAIGAWMKNFGDDPDTVYYFINSTNNVLLEFANMDDFSSRDYLQKAENILLPFYWQGTGLHVLNHDIFFHRNGTLNEIVKYNLQNNATRSMHLDGAGHSPPYQLSPYTKIDLAWDEQGLWAIYTDVDTNGNIILSKIDHNKMEVENVWNTTCTSSNAESSFVICGTLYVMYNSPSGGRSHIDCVYDTSDIIDGHDIPTLYFTKRYSSHSSVHYNPRDQSLYAWDDGYQVIYKFESKNKFEHF